MKSWFGDCVTAFHLITLLINRCSLSTLLTLPWKCGEGEGVCLFLLFDKGDGCRVLFLFFCRREATSFFGGEKRNCLNPEDLICWHLLHSLSLCLSCLIPLFRATVRGDKEQARAALLSKLVYICQMSHLAQQKPSCTCWGMLWPPGASSVALFPNRMLMEASGRGNSLEWMETVDSHSCLSPLPTQFVSFSSTTQAFLLDPVKYIFPPMGIGKLRVLPD